MPEFAKRNIIVFVYAALILSTLLVFWQVRNFDFAGYDDNDYVCENPHVLSGLTQDSIIWAFTTGHASNWHPLTWLSLMLDCQLFGKNPGRMHLMNLFLHLANTLLLFAILKKMTTALWPSAFVAAVFALHPMHVESVAWIAERKDLLSTLFLLLTLAAYVSYVKHRGIIRYMLTLLLFALGLLAKPMLVTLPFLLLLLDYWPLNRFTAEFAETAEKKNKISSACSAVRSAGWLIFEKTPFIALSIVSSVITFLVQRSGGAMASIDILSLKDRIANSFLSYARYTGKLFVPNNLAVFYPGDIHTFLPWHVAACVFLLVAVSVLVICFGRNRKYLPVGWFWFVGTLVPVIGFVQVGGQAYADRYTYIPYIGLFIMLAWGLPELLSKCPLLSETSLKAGPQRKVVLGLVMIMVLATLGILAHKQVGFWKNSFTLFSRAIEVTQNNALAQYNFGTICLSRGRYQDAIESFKQAIRIKPDNVSAHYNLGCACDKLGRIQEAIAAYQQSIRIKPDLMKAYINLGIAYSNLGRYQDALETYKQAIRIKQDDADTFYNLGCICDKLGRIQEAIAAYQQSIKIKPDLMEAYINLGVVYSNLGRYQDALETYQQALKIKPDFTDAYVAMGVIYNDIGRYEDAIDYWKQALKIKPDFAEVYSNIGVVFYKLGSYKEAIESLKQAVRIKPNYIDAHSNLGKLYLVIGDKNSALEEYKILKTLDTKQADQLYNLIHK